METNLNITKRSLCEICRHYNICEYASEGKSVCGKFSNIEDDLK